MGSQPILPALPNPSDSGMTKGEAKEFGSALAQLKHVSDQVNNMHLELREHMIDEDKKHEAQQERIVEVEKKLGALETHLQWVKGIAAAVQAAIVGWLGIKS